MSLPTNFAVRWIDKEGTERQKEYTGLSRAREAEASLRERGATDVDIAVVLRVAPPVVEPTQPWNETD